MVVGNSSSEARGPDVKLTTKNLTDDSHKVFKLKRKNVQPDETAEDPTILAIDMEEEAFCLGYIPLDVFEQKLKAALKKVKHSKSKIQSINLSRNGYVTDVVIKKLVDIMGEKNLSRIIKVSLEGCSTITDVGLHWLVQGLRKNKHSIMVNINGCSKITDGGLATLETLLKLEYTAMATSVTYLNRAGQTANTSLFVNKDNLKTVIKKESYVMIVPIFTKFSLAEFLKSKTPKQREPFHYLEDVNILDWNINLAELEQNHVLFEHMLPECPVHVILPFSADDLSTEQLKDQITETIAHVLSKEYLNPRHRLNTVNITNKSNRFTGDSVWMNCLFSTVDGVMRNIPGNSDVGIVISHVQLSRTNNFFEVQSISSEPEIDIFLGFIRDEFIPSHNFLEDDVLDRIIYEKFQLEDKAIYGFGVLGNWKSEYTLSEDAVYYCTKNGVEILRKNVPDLTFPKYPVVCINGKNRASVKILSQACPPETLVELWEENKQYWTPKCLNNIFCDNTGILRCETSDEDVEESDKNMHIGLMLCQEDITKEHNTFSIQVLNRSSGIITMGLGPEDYPLYNCPGWQPMSLGLHGDDGKIYVESGKSSDDNGSCQIWQKGDVIKMVVNLEGGESENLQSDDNIKVDFYINSNLIETVNHRMTNNVKRTRFVFMVGMRGKDTQVKMLNYKPPFHTTPFKTDMLTMGRSHYFDVYDDGRFVCRGTEHFSMKALFLSHTPFSAKLTYFELKVNNWDEDCVCIGFAHREYPANELLGDFPGSFGYHVTTIMDSDDTSNSSKNQDNASCGDIIGCGFDVKSAKFRKDGSLENQQILKFYFCRNGEKVFETEFEYMTDGIYPGVNLYNKGGELVLFNYHPGFVNEQNKTEKRNKQPTQEEKFVEGCQFTLVSMGNNEEGSRKKLQALQKLLIEAMQFPVLSVLNKKIEEMENDLNLMNLQGQQNYSQLCWQKESLERFLATKSRINFMSVDVSTGQGHKKLTEYMAHVCELDLVNHFKYYDINECVYSGLQKLKSALKTEKLLAANQIIDLAVHELGQNGNIFEAAFKHLKTKGCLITFPYMKTNIAMDIQFAKLLMSMPATPPNAFSGKITPFIGMNTPIWNKVTDIIPTLQHIPHKIEFLSHVLQFFGALKIPCLRVCKCDPAFFYATLTTIKELPVQLSHFIETVTEENLVLVKREYQILYSSANRILLMIISKCLLFFHPLAITQNWGVFQSGAAQTVIYVKEDHGLTLETRCFMPSERSDCIDSDTQYHVEEYAFNIFCIFVDIIDYIIAKMNIRYIFTEQVPPNLVYLVNCSIGCIHHWSLSSQPYRQTVCTLCSQCCDLGQCCPYNGLPGEYQHQCGCNTHITGCKDCGICQSCASQLWAIRSYLRPNLEVASYNEMKSCQIIPLNVITYDEVEFTNLGSSAAAICLKRSTDQTFTTASVDNSGSLIELFPGAATVFPNKQRLQKHLKKLKIDSSNLMSLERNDTITIKLNPVKGATQKMAEVEEEHQTDINPQYFTSICRNTKVWHETGVVAYTSLSPDIPVGQFISASPLTPECPAFSFQILTKGNRCAITIGVCQKRFPPNKQPGWIKGSLAYHADDGGVFTGPESDPIYCEKCEPEDIMKCQLNFEQQSVTFYKNDKLVFDSEKYQFIKTGSLDNYHAAIGFHSFGEAVCLLEKEPWQITDDDEQSVLPDAFDCYSYGNMQISPGKTLSFNKFGNEITSWLMINNPSKNPVGYKISSPLVSELVSYLKPSMSAAFRLQANFKQDDKSLLKYEQYVDIHWFLLESNFDYSDKDIGQVYLTMSQESLMKHQLRVKMTEAQTTDPQPLKLASETPDDNDSYIAEVLKNGISVQKYWLPDGNYVCCLPLDSSVLVRYPKFPTLSLPNRFQKGMRVVLDLTSVETDLYAEAVIQKATVEGDLELLYSEQGEPENTTVEMNAVLSQIAKTMKVKGHLHEQGQGSVNMLGTVGLSASSDKLASIKQETDMTANMILTSFQPRGNIAVTKRAYIFPPFHLLTEASHAAIISFDAEWKSNSLKSVAQCKNLPTRLTVQELQISKLVGNSLDWLVGATSPKLSDLAFAFLPAKLGLTDLCFPRIPNIFTEVSVHRLCFLVDQMYNTIHLAKQHNIIFDAPLHFVNVTPTPPVPPLSNDVMFASSFSSWTYSTLYSNKLYLPLSDNIFQEGKPDFSRPQLEQLMNSLIHVYAAQCHIFAEQHGGVIFQKIYENVSKTIASSIEDMDTNYVESTDKAVLSSETLIKKPFRNNVYCKAHQWCLSGNNISMEEEFNFKSELFQPYEETVNFLFRDMPRVTNVRPDFYSFFQNLQYLRLQNCGKMKELPNGISKCLRLKMVSLKNSAFEVLPSDLFEIPCLQKLHCVVLKVQALPTTFIASSPISELILSNLQLTSVPKELGNLSNLECLNLNSNPLEMLPMELKSLTKLKTLLLCGIPWIVTAGSKVEMPLDQYEDFLKETASLTNYIGREKLIALFNKCDKNKNSQLDENEIAALNVYLFWKVPRLGSSCISCNEYGGIPPVIFLLSSLETLHLDFQAITCIPVHIWRLHNLKVLSISNNPLLESLSGSMGHLPSLKSIRLKSNPSLRTPPQEVVSRGIVAVMAYLKRLAGGFAECRRTKLMLVGLGGAGKTSLLRALMSSSKKTAGTKGEDITNGIEIHSWKIKSSDNVTVTYNAWDFAGQTLYYNTHQFFLSKRAVYLLLWSTRQGFEHAGLEFWLSSISSHAPKTPIFIVGTHRDQVSRADIPMSDLQKRYPQIVGFHFVSSVEGTGVAELEKELLRVTLELKNMGEKVPQVWLNLEKKILAAKNENILPWQVIKDYGTEVGIFDDKDIREAIQFLHELGTVQYFNNQFLRDQVVINPQWIVNVMSCLVSVKESPIKENNGKFYHKHMSVIWKSYPPELHEWLLQLTEEFDLTFPLPGEDSNIVPCLLPHDIPQNFVWPIVDNTENIKETRFTYRFTYLPAGLFNRVQVRLFQFSDGKMIWKRGSLLKKNKHQALILQTSDSELIVKVQGPRPENVLFLIHEIIESLIQESFHGVIYDVFIPCPDCINKEGTLEPCMFKGCFVKRAREHKAPFLQCKKYFHTITLAQLYEMMPSDLASDFDVQMQHSLTIMQQLNSAMSTDVAIIYCALDIDNNQSGVSPVQIKKDLEKGGLTCWFSHTMDTANIQDIMLALKNCKVVVALLSDNFEKDERTRNLLLYTMDTLVKDFIIVVIGDSLKWENTDLGMRIGKQENCIMIKNKSRYDARVGEMIDTVKHKLKENQQQIQDNQSVFISYCWSNSRHAQSRGTNCPPGAVGWGDPREIKKELEKRGLDCWIDIDQPATGRGLFKNIAQGIINSKVFVAFVSNEYDISNNCMMELRFAILNMKMPVVVAVVGTGKDWKQSEVGILMQRSQAVKINFQKKNPNALDNLHEHIMKLKLSNNKETSAPFKVMTAKMFLQNSEKNKSIKEQNEPDSGKYALQEEFELMQRKFMRHIIPLVSSMYCVPLPHLIVVDFEKQGHFSVIDDTNEKTKPERKSKRQAVRSLVGSQSFRRTSNNLTIVPKIEDRWERESFCLKILCEDEKGWHVCDKVYPIKMNDEFKKIIKGCSAYLARMYAILRQSAVTLNCFDGKIGSSFISWIEQNASENINFIDSYITIQTKLDEDDKSKEFLSQLRRCHLPTGKIYWLCGKHSTGLRITQLSTEVATRNEIGQVYYEEDIKLKEEIEHSKIYKERKVATSPSSGIVLPIILDALPQSTLVSKNIKVDVAALKPPSSGDMGTAQSDYKPNDSSMTESSISITQEKKEKSKTCSIQ